MDANPNFVDQLLDASLACYGSAEPRTGLEQRVLARLADEPQPTVWQTWRWLPIGAVATVVLLAAVLLTTRKETGAPPVAKVPPVVRTSPAPVTPETPAPPQVAVSRPGPPAIATGNVAIRAQQFPRPGSLTEEERHLMSYLNTQPREVLVAAVRSDAGSNRPLAELMVREVEVPRLELKPLPEQSGEATKN